jgi:hypothetical protein
MAITSHAFGRVTLTEEDADKFARQVKYGRTSKSAKDAVARGAAIAQDVKRTGKFSFSIKKPARGKAGFAAK